jgi:hypothetical protein
MTKWSNNIYQHLHLEDTPKHSQFGIFGTQSGSPASFTFFKVVPILDLQKTVSDEREMNSGFSQCCQMAYF